MSAIVLLHGWGMNAAVFDALSAELAAEHEVIALPLPGYDDGSVPDFDCAVERIAGQAPARCCALGWSLGAQFALAWGRAHPRQVERLVLIAATPCFVRRADWPCAVDPQDFAAFEAALADGPRTALSRFTALQAQGDEDERDTHRRLRAALDARAVPSATVLGAGLAQLRENDMREALSAIGQPARVIHGERDRLVPAAAARYLADALPRGRYAPVEGAAHAPFVSRPAQVARMVEAFLA